MALFNQSPRSPSSEELEDRPSDDADATVTLNDTLTMAFCSLVPKSSEPSESAARSCGASLRF